MLPEIFDLCLLPHFGSLARVFWRNFIAVGNKQTTVIYYIHSQNVRCPVGPTKEKDRLVHSMTKCAFLYNQCFSQKVGWESDSIVLIWVM
jgi:hypothetical protein